MASLAEQLEQSHREIAQLTTRLDELQRSREERIALLTEENRWLKQQLFGPLSEKRASEDVSPDQQRLVFNEAEMLAPATDGVPATVAIPAHAQERRPQADPGDPAARRSRSRSARGGEGLCTRRYAARADRRGER